MIRISKALVWIALVGTGVSPFARAAESKEAEMARCLSAMTILEDYVHNNQLHPGGLPGVVKTSGGKLAVWRRASGEVLVSDGAHLFTAGNPVGNANAIVYGKDPSAPAEHQVVASLFRRVQIPGGPSFDLHRLADGKTDFARLPGQDDQLLEVDRRLDQKKLGANLKLLGETLLAYERNCREPEPPMVDEKLSSYIGNLTASLTASLNHYDPKASRQMELEGQQEALENFVGEIDAVKQRSTNFDRAAQALQQTKSEAQKPGNQIEAKPVAAAALEEIFEEAKQQFAARVAAENLPFPSQKQDLTDGCGSLVTLGGAAPKPKDAITQGVEKVIPDEVMPLYKAFTNQK